VPQRSCSRDCLLSTNYIASSTEIRLHRGRCWWVHYDASGGVDTSDDTSVCKWSKQSAQLCENCIVFCIEPRWWTSFSGCTWQQTSITVFYFDNNCFHHCIMCLRRVGRPTFFSTSSVALHDNVEPYVIAFPKQILNSTSWSLSAAHNKNVRMSIATACIADN